MKYYIFDCKEVSKMYEDGIIPKNEILYEFEYHGDRFFLSNKEIINKDKNHRKKCISEFSKWIRQEFNRHRKYILTYSNICLLENDCYDLLSDYLKWEDFEANDKGESYVEIICKSSNIAKTVDKIIKSLAIERLTVSSRDLFLEIKYEGNDNGLDIQKVKDEIHKVEESINNKTFRWML